MSSKAWWERFTGFDATDWALRLTLLGLLLKPIGDWRLRPWILALAALGLLAPGFLRSRWLWAALAGLTATRVVLAWPLLDNHAYLLVYWCLAVFLGLASAQPDTALAKSGRRLIGLAFGMAIIWKLVLSPDFADGTFFRLALLTDPRFEDFARLAGGLDASTLETLRAYVGGHTDTATTGSVAPEIPRRLWHLGTLLTLFTLATESLGATAFLWPGVASMAKWRDVSLLFFCLSVYSVATVAGFGWLLLAMGLAQCGSDRPRTRMAYVVAFLAILLYREIPWLRVFAQGG